MISKMKIILVAVVVIFGVNGISFAMSCDMGSKNDSGQAYAEDAEKGSKVANIGNKVCPISGEKIDESKKATYEYNGKIYNFCCPMCIDDFKNDPDKYAAKAEQGAGSVSSAHEDHHNAH